ncbi:MAG: DEAD/DEAH box helicase [Candidatus Micrarchaeota archaeon]|nr:DEAD/DEAH box helicase [Candidatus Micrarchaeota archaeon]
MGYFDGQDLKVDLCKKIIDAIDSQSKEGYSTISSRSAQEFTLEYEGKTHHFTPIAINSRIVRSEYFRRKGITTQLQAKNYIAEIAGTRSLLKSLRVYKPVPIEYLAENGFCKEIVDSITSRQYRGFPAILSKDRCKFSIEYNGETYVLTLGALTTRLADSEAFPEIKTQLQAKNYIYLVAGGMPSRIALKSIEGGVVQEELEDEILGEFDSLNAEHAVSLLGRDPAKLKSYLIIAHPELELDTIDEIVKASFKGLYSRISSTKEAEYMRYNVSLAMPSIITKIAGRTRDDTVYVNGKALGASHVYVAGVWNRRITVRPDGTFTASIPLRIGKSNEVRLFAIERYKQQRSEALSYSITQTGSTTEEDALIMLLTKLGSGIKAQLQKDPARFNFLVDTVEHALIKGFTIDFSAGKRNLEKLISRTDDRTVKLVLKRVMSNFEEVNRSLHEDITPGERLFFFQKYCMYAIKKRMDAGSAGVILANEPGLGKTLVGLLISKGHPTLIISPNSVVSTWVENQERFTRDYNLVNLKSPKNRGVIGHSERKAVLKALVYGGGLRGASSSIGMPALLTNIEFLRKPEDRERFELLNRALSSGSKASVYVFDEAHSLANIDTKQTEGAQKIKADFQLYMTASPFRDPVTVRRMLHNLFPNDKRFGSDNAFTKAFPRDDPAALRELNLIQREWVIRFRKQDVLIPYDRSKPLNEQKGGYIAHKEYMPTHSFTLSMGQAMSIYKMLVRWPEWAATDGMHITKDWANVADGVWQNGSLSKSHAIRQISNSPANIGIKSRVSPKHVEMKNIVNEAVSENRKVLIFCAYRHQAEEYSKMFNELNPALYIGYEQKSETDKLVLDSTGAPKLFKFDERSGYATDKNGYPVGDSNGKPMLLLDYERTTFMNAPDRKVMIATYKTGGIGVTLNAAKAVVFDDLPDTYVDQYQAEDRAHRVDTDITRTQYDVKYYKLVSRYPKEFLDKMKDVWVRRNENGSYTVVENRAEAKEEHLDTAYNAFFSQGTYDEVQERRLEMHRQMFQLINDGIADEEVLKEAQVSDPYRILRGENGNGFGFKLRK